jgi:tripartite-type tricarboxylate transporter receptor subunit TctC
MIGSAPIIAITANDSPYKSLKDVVEAARKDPQAVMYGSSGNGSPLHLAGELFVSIAKVPMTHVPTRRQCPYRGSDRRAHSGHLRYRDQLHAAAARWQGAPPAVGSTTRLPELPNVPTFAEAGYPQFEFSAWYAVCTVQDQRRCQRQALRCTGQGPQAARGGSKLRDLA